MTVVKRVQFFLLYLGSGKALELYLIGIKLALAIDIMTPTRAQIPVISDLVWWVPEPLIAMPLFLIGLVQLCGVVLNYNGHEISWIPRFFGALGGCFIWTFIVCKSLWIGELHTGLFPFSAMSFVASGFIAWRAWNRLPIPGLVSSIV